MKVLFVWPNKDSFGCKVIGLALLSAIAKRMGCETRLFDTTGIDFGYTDNSRSGETAKVFKPVDLAHYNLKKEKCDVGERFSQALSDYNPDCVALSVLSDEFLIASAISRISKKLLPHVPVLWGNKYPTINPETALILHGADFACRGEGLNAFTDFLDALAGKGDPYKIPNIWAKRNGSVIKNNIRPLIRELDSLPYVDWEIFDKRHFIKPFDGRAYTGGDHMLNWGCPYHCTYCINHFYNNLYNKRYAMRRYSTERIIKELKYLKEKYNLQFFKFYDEDFLMRPLDNLKELSESYKSEIGLPFSIETNPKSVTEKKVALLKEMNCASASIAIETGDPHLRKDVLRRVDSREDVIRAFSLCKEAGIRTSSFNMLGIPFETRDSFMKTIELNRAASVQYPNMGFFFPFEGTELRDVSIREGYLDPSRSAVYERDRPALYFKDLSEEELIGMRNGFVLYVKLPSSFEPFIRRSEKRDPIGKALRGKLLSIYDKTIWGNDGWYADDGMHETYIRELEKVLDGETVPERT